MLNAQRLRKRDKDRERVHRMSQAQYLDLLVFQEGFCPCGNRTKHIDHDHQLAKLHDHPADQSCKLCWRGLLCHTCNSDILGRGYNQRRLLALVAYLDNPPAMELFQREAS